MSCWPTRSHFRETANFFYQPQHALHNASNIREFHQDTEKANPRSRDSRSRACSEFRLMLAKWSPGSNSSRGCNCPPVPWDPGCRSKSHRGISRTASRSSIQLRWNSNLWKKLWYVTVLFVNSCSGLPGRVAELAAQVCNYWKDQELSGGAVCKSMRWSFAGNKQFVIEASDNCTSLHRRMIRWS